MARPIAIVTDYRYTTDSDTYLLNYLIINLTDLNGNNQKSCILISIQNWLDYL